ncbi:hypothetical protein GCM10028862_05250 [Luteimonas pelagia]
MSPTLGLTGMDRDTEAAVKAAFAEASAQAGGGWTLVPEAEADHVVVDMDSMYGPMSWLKLHGAGKTVIGLTTAPRTQTDFHLQKPCTVQGLAGVLSAIMGQAADPLAAGASAEAAPTPVSEPSPELTEAVSMPGPEDDDTAAVPSGVTPAPAPQDMLPEEVPSAGVHGAPPPEPEPPAPARDPVFSDWLAPGRLTGRRRYQRDDGPALLIDADARQYHGPASLKPLAAYFDGTVQEGDLVPVDEAAWQAEAGKHGDAQPLSRLAWYGGLLAGGGALMPGFPADAQYRLLKWPQTEREFPRHFRIATAMMKGPATIDEIAEASGVPAADVADFVNANLATGFAERYVEPEPEPEPQQKGGLFGRLRGR